MSHVIRHRNDLTNSSDFISRSTGILPQPPPKNSRRTDGTDKVGANTLAILIKKR